MRDCDGILNDSREDDWSIVADAKPVCAENTPFCSLEGIIIGAIAYWMRAKRYEYEEECFLQENYMILDAHERCNYWLLIYNTRLYEDTYIWNIFLTVLETKLIGKIFFPSIFDE